MGKFKFKILDDTLEKCGIMFPDLINFENGTTINAKCVSENPPIVNLDVKLPSLTEHIDTTFTVDNEDVQIKKSPYLTKEELNNDTIIKNISYDQNEILWNIMQLYNEGKPFECDMTASELKFYEGKGGKYDIPTPKILFDVFPKDERIKKIEPLGRLPLEDNSIDSIVIDLPFVISGEAKTKRSDCTMLIYSRFHGYYPADDMYESYFHWISEAYRVLKENGICVFKTQSTVSGGVQHNTEEFSFMSAQKVGFTIEDKFILEAKARLISPGKYKKQMHARKYTSVFYVFQKTLKKKNKNFNYFDLIEKEYVKEANRYGEE